MDKIIIEKNNTTRVQIEQSDYQGQGYIDIRLYYLDKDGEYKPTRKGLTLTIDKWQEIIQQLAQELSLN